MSNDDAFSCDDSVLFIAFVYLVAKQVFLLDLNNIACVHVLNYEAVREGSGNHSAVISGNKIVIEDLV